MSKGPDSWTYPDLPGVVQRKDNGKASSRWFYQGKYHRRTHPIPWDRKNKGLIRPLHRQFVAEIVGGQYKGNGKRTIERLETAKREYFRSQSKRLTAASRQEAEQAFAYYLDMDMPLKRDTLRHHILRRLDEPPPGRSALANETARKYLTRVRRFCRWCVESRHLDASPMEGIALPPQRRTRKSEQDIFSAEEVSAVVGWYRERAGRQGDWRFRMQNLEHAILIELVYLVGLRPSEALRARWEDITPDGWVIWGKASPTRAGENERSRTDYRDPRKTRDDHARKRVIPLRRTSARPELQRWYDRIATLLDELREHEEHHDGWLFGTRYTQVANRGLADGLDGAGIERRERTFRRLRHSARWLMEERLRLDSQTIADLLGHSEIVSLRDYRTAPDPDTIAERMSR